MKSITYIVQSMTIPGGLERVLTDRLNALVLLGCYKLSVICVSQTSDEKNYYKLSNKIEQYNLGYSFNPITSFKSNPLRFIYERTVWEIKYNKECKRLLDIIKPDILVSTVFFVPSCFYWFKGKKVLESHGDRASMMSSRMFPLLSRFAERCANVVVTLTNEDKKAYTAAKRVEVIPNFTDIKPSEVAVVRRQSMVAVGRLCHQKGFDLLIDAWAKIAKKYPHWQLEIYGEGPDEQLLNNKIMTLGLSDKVFLRGAIKDIAAVYSTHSVLLFSSRYEGFGMVLIEAMVCGLPCVAFDCPCGPSDIIDNGVNGLLIELRGLTRELQVEKFASGIEWMIQNPEKRELMGQLAKNKVDCFSKKIIIEKLINLYDNL